MNLDNFLPYRLSFTSNLVSEAVATVYETLFGLTIPQWRVIAHVAAHAGITQQDICTRTRMDKVTISRAAIALKSRGFIDRKPNPGDGRSQLLILSAAGQKLYAEVSPKALELERMIFGCFTHDEVALFTAMLRRIDSHILTTQPEPGPLAGNSR